MYNYYRTGYNFNAGSTMHLAPTAVKENLRIITPSGEEGYIDLLNDINNGKVKLSNNDIVMFANQYIMNHLDDKNFVYTPKGNALGKIRSKAFNSETGKFKGLFTVSTTELGYYANQILIYVDQKNGYSAFRPVIAFTEGDSTYYYMASNKGRFNKTDVGSETMTYVRVYPQGKRGLMTRYFGDEGYSMFNDNGGKFETKSDIKLSDYKNKEEDINTLIPEEGSMLSDGQSDSPIDYWVASPDKTIFDVFDTDTLNKMYSVLINKYNLDKDYYKSITLEEGVALKEPIEIFKIFDKSDAEQVKELNEIYQEVEEGN